MISAHTIAFYNLENLFDPFDGEHTLDKNFTPDGIYRWDRKKYRRKIENLSQVISRIGPESMQDPPAIVGVCEVENQSCLEDLVQSESLEKHGYGFVHFESKDRRGLDTALLFRKAAFNPVRSAAFGAEVPGRLGPEPTRDILHVEGDLFGFRIHVLVNHWPSRIQGARSTRNKRRRMAHELDRVVNSIHRTDPEARILILGDFNDQPGDYSLRKAFSHNFYNIFGQCDSNRGSTRYRGKWVAFDQILVSEMLLKDRQLNYLKGDVFRPSYLIESQGRHKGSPKRSFRGRFFQNGYSDHFPVYVVMKLDHP